MKSLMYVTLLFLILQAGQAQTLLSSGGAFHQGNDFNIHWSLGEFIVDTHVDTTLIISKGFHQGDLKASTYTQENETLSLILHPNPCMDFMQITGYENMIFEGNIIDNTGRIIKLIHGKESIIDVSDLNSGLYYIVFKNSRFVISPIKFIKI